MAKKKDNLKEAELFEVPAVNEEVQAPVEENQEVVIETPAEENQEMEMEIEGSEMEMELDGEEIQGEMEELVAEKVKKEERDNQEQKHKRGPKPGGRKEEKEINESPVEKKEKALNLKDINIIQREIKKGRLAAPQGRIEKTEAGDYVMKLAEGIIFPQDVKDNFKEIGKIAKMNDGKFVLTNYAANTLKVDKFIAKHENGEEIEHQYVRVELHKPGREKDVVELYTVTDAKNYLKIQDAKLIKKEEEAKKKAEKEKAEKEKEAKDALKETLTEENKEAAV
jgi:hypothetical protein